MESMMSAKYVYNLEESEHVSQMRPAEIIDHSSKKMGFIGTSMPFCGAHRRWNHPHQQRSRGGAGSCCCKVATARTREEARRF